MANTTPFRLINWLIVNTSELFACILVALSDSEMMMHLSILLLSAPLSQSPNSCAISTPWLTSVPRNALGESRESSTQDLPTSASLSWLILVQLTDLAKIIEAMMKDVFSTKLIKLARNDLVAHRVTKLEELNMRISQWHAALPELLTWSQWTPTTKEISPHLLILQ